MVDLFATKRIKQPPLMDKHLLGGDRTLELPTSIWNLQNAHIINENTHNIILFIFLPVFEIKLIKYGSTPYRRCKQNVGNFNGSHCKTRMLTSKIKIIQRRFFYINCPRVEVHNKPTDCIKPMTRTWDVALVTAVLAVCAMCCVCWWCGWKPNMATSLRLPWRNKMAGDARTHTDVVLLI